MLSIPNPKQAGAPTFLSARLGWFWTLLCSVALAFLACKQELAGKKWLGQRIDVQFTAVDGRQVDLAKLGGKVVLIDFWASWCGPCLQEIPLVKAAYDKFHARGFEVIGISLDDKKEELMACLTQKKIEWPQYFDPSGFENKLAKKFGIEEIPVMWLVDKEGKLRQLDATEDLAEKVEKLLAEPEASAGAPTPKPVSGTK